MAGKPWGEVESSCKKCLSQGPAAQSWSFLPQRNAPFAFGTEGRYSLLRVGVTALWVCTTVVCQSKVRNGLTFSDLPICFLLPPQRSGKGRVCYGPELISIWV